MKKLIKEDMTMIIGGLAIQDEKPCVKTGDLCNSGDICCDKTKGYKGKCESKEAARCD